ERWRGRADRESRARGRLRAPGLSGWWPWHEGSSGLPTGRVHPEGAAGESAGGPAVVDDAFAVDDDVADAARLLFGIVERRGVGDRGRFEQHQIGGVALADEAAVGEPKPLCGTAGQVVDAFLEAQQADLADVVSQVAWKGAPRSRMWSIADQNGIAASHVLGVHHDCANILLVADMLQNRGSQLVAPQQIEEHVHRRESTVGRDRVDRPADVLVKGGVADSADLDGLPFHGDAVTAVGAVNVDVLGDSRAGLRIMGTL